jgi:predicted nicotinamide N-methyase
LLLPTPQITKTLRLSATSSNQEGERIRRKLRLPSGTDANLLSRDVPITSDWSITVWEWENPAQIIESYWEAAQRQNSILVRDSRSLLDPFGFVSWPGSVVAAQELHRHQKTAVHNQRVLIFGAGVGVEAQAVAMLGAKEVLATDIHPTTLQQLAYGVSQEPQKIPEGVISTQILDLFAHEDTEPIPDSDLLIVADVLYNEQLASQVCRRIAEGVAQNPKIRVLVTDSQRFVPTFTTELQKRLGEQVATPIEWQEKTLQQFTGSGVCIDEDQTYDVKVRTLWIGL